MRQSYLESYYSLIPKTQQDRLLSVLKSRFEASGQTPSDSSLIKEMENLIAELKKPLGEPLIQLRKTLKFGKISSKDYNNSMDETYVDLGALFKQNNTITRTIKTHKLLNDAVLMDIRAAMAKIENDIVVYKIIKENKTGITDVKFNSFYKNDNQSTDKVYAAQVDTEINAVKLPKGLDHSSLSLNGLAMAEIDLYHFGGGIKGTIEDESHNKERAIDGSMLTFWGETILTDEPIRQIYNGSTEFGAICEIVISLFRADLINNIRYSPFANYPLTVMKIYYSTTSDGSWVDLGVASQSSTSTMEFNFSEVLAKKIKIVINQENPSVNTYRIPRRVINNAMMWQQIVDREMSISTETTEPIQATQDMIDYITGWQAYVDATESYKQRVLDAGKPVDYTNKQSISETQFDSATKEMTKSGTGDGVNSLKLDLYGKKAEADEELVEVRKYEYTYGAYNIDIRKVWYMETGEYISPQYEPNGTVIEARLDISEIVPSGTTIEYQVATRPNEWKNILPSGGYISKERIDIDSYTQTGKLRFPCSGSIGAIYRNDILIPLADYTYNQPTSEVVVGSGWYMASAAFTASYMPDGVGDVVPSGVIVNFIEDTMQDSYEVRKGVMSRQYKVELDHFPYVEYEIINNTSKAGKSSPDFFFDDGRWLNLRAYPVSNIEGGEYYDVIQVTVDGVDAINRTDYYENIRPALTQFNDPTYPFYEYVHSGKNIYVNVDLSNREVKTRYKYVNDFIQLKALLRNNTRGNVSVTPTLEDFTLKLRTI